MNNRDLPIQEYRLPVPSLNDSLIFRSQIALLTDPVKKISDSIDPHELSYNTSLTPCTDIRKDISDATIQLFDIHNKIYHTLNPTQELVISTYHNLLASIARYFRNAPHVSEPTTLRRS